MAHLTQSPISVKPRKNDPAEITIKFIHPVEDEETAREVGVQFILRFLAWAWLSVKLPTTDCVRRSQSSALVLNQSTHSDSSASNRPCGYGARLSA